MMELLTAKDVEVKAFKKVSFGGYAVQEVEDFLNQVADDFETYAMRLNERETRIRELEEYVKKQESMTDMIKDALIQARKGAKEMEEEARAQTEQILADARVEAEKCLSEANSKVEEITSQADTTISNAEKTAAEIVAEANAKSREIDSQSHMQLDEAEKAAAEIIAKAKASAAGILQEAQDMRLETERRWADLEQDLSHRKKEASEQIEQTLASARSEAKRLLEEASKEVENYNNRLRFLNLRKQQFLKDTVALLLDFGKTIDKAQQEFEVEMMNEEEKASDKTEAEPPAESGRQDASSSRLLDHFRRNFLEGKSDDSEKGEF
ncbi:DivIVA domain-containing protein [uncultured Fretibacterium sp.]|uniref:DivIVA domain-containing protein n=1 Tax=uncultured Fretibacterium sp. TaxID=1678694 RepID=UPI002636B0E4|nr:DivIVA domain-containing protein [uncultured Fretibacterium sp.]